MIIHAMHVGIADRPCRNSLHLLPPSL